MVSVIVAVYNGEKFIKETVERALEQTYKPEEVIVIDDASTDGTQEVIQKNFHDRVYYYRNTKNMERCYSRNRGYALSKGEFVFFLDHDDLWEVNHLERTLNQWGQAHMLYSFPRKLIDQEGRLIKRSGKELPEDPYRVVFSGMVGYPSATAFRRGYFLEYVDKYLVREDWEVFLRASLLGYNIKITDTDTVMIREHSGRTSKSRRLYEGTIRVYEDYVSKIPEAYLPYFLFHVGDVCMRFGELKKGWSMVLKAIRQEPELLTSGRNLLSIIKRGFRFWRSNV
ncbi:MAG: glycosyltransferase family 2 protein [Aquificaceae bacterium]|nr:glycosyltransferase family 2 protein [Aquificaceae bacterium]MDW8433586.1 glycosyltransferase family 2 protein [Aquificaceae bacterium]